ncbi:predicted protein [Naegleria gruberi]|uniref:Large ribosomal subunit protein mL54 n=1 Tax=Naegleria gruberi TaxID=5762 RepID=D2V0F8_NAEGR|nr:uncharacterized protein NAEGRDRAFT_62280 [Naegleria gruberi]EFC49712.1 predicted protein [Naegleria gruberi]|eukprot:XP_002682456.1 predicted protein [Naegleria gruberi strain NEG-M]
MLKQLSTKVLSPCLNNNNTLKISICTSQLRTNRLVAIKSLSKQEIKDLVKKYGPEAPKGSKGFGQEGHELNINILKEGKNPVIKAPEAYPEWLLEISRATDLSLEQLKSKKASGQQLTFAEVKRMHKLMRRQKIKENNYNRTMGIVLA